MESFVFFAFLSLLFFSEVKQALAPSSFNLQIGTWKNSRDDNAHFSTIQFLLDYYCCQPSQHHKLPIQASLFSDRRTFNVTQYISKFVEVAHCNVPQGVLHEAPTKMCGCIIQAHVCRQETSHRGFIDLRSIARIL